MDKFGRKLVKGFLHTKDTKIVNGDNQEIILEGYGVGNWVNPEGFMCGSFLPFMNNSPGDLFNGKDGKRVFAQWGRFERYRTITSTVRELCGEEYLKTFWPRWHANHLSEADIKAMADLDLNSVRLVLNAATLLKEEPGIHFIEEGFAVLEQAIDWCEKYNIYAILDMHAAPGGQTGGIFDNSYDNMPRLWFDQESWDRTLILWEEIAKRFGDRWIVGGYDLLNEPLSVPVDKEAIPKLSKFYDECIQVIRKHDTKHMFFLEPAGFARYTITFDHDYDPGYHNWAIHLHRYGFKPEISELTPYLRKGQEYNVPVWIGEGGSSPEANAVFFNIAQEYGIGFCLWCWKTAYREDGPKNVGHKLPKDWDLIEEYIQGGSKPPYEKAIQIFDEYLDNMKFEKCIVDFGTINRSRRIVPFDLPAVGYDHSEKNGETYVGDWALGNLLNYRLGDRTKLVWDNRYTEPVLWMNEDADARMDPVPDNRNPITRLWLEMKEGEFAVYTVRKAPQGACLSLEAKSFEDATIEVLLDGQSLGTIEIQPSESESYVCENQVKIPPCEQGKVKLLVKKGVAQFYKLHFATT